MNSDKTPRQNRVREALGRIYDQQPPLFREYMRRYKEDPTSRVFAPLAEAYRRLGRIDEAIEICREGLEHHPDFHGGRVALAKCYLEKKQHGEAKAELEKVIRIVPENLLAQRLLGDTYLALKNPRAALHCYKMALLLSPNDVGLAERVHALETAEASVEARAPRPPAESPVPPSMAPQAMAPAPKAPRAASPAPVPSHEPPSLNNAISTGDLELPALWQEVEGTPLSPVQRPSPDGLSLDSIDNSPIELETSPELEASPELAVPPELHSPVPVPEVQVPQEAAPVSPSPSVPLNEDIWNDLEVAPPVVEPAAMEMAAPAEEDESTVSEMSAEDKARVDSLLGIEASVSEEEAFKIEHVSSIFGEPAQATQKELTTETLGDLYFSQGQFDTALRIFERLGGTKPPADLEKKITACRMKLGVGREVLVRNRQIEVLQALLSRAKAARGHST